MQNHQTLSSLPPLPEGGDVPERAIVTDDSQETSVRDSEPAESEKSAGSSDKVSESGHASGSSQTDSVPPAVSPQNARDRGHPTRKTPVSRSYLSQLPKNLLPKNKRSLIPLLLLLS